MKKKISIERTRKGHAALWECGGSTTSMGEARIIASHLGEAKKAVYVRQRGELCNAHHALVIVSVGDHIVDCDHHHEDFQIYIYRIIDIDGDQATVELMYEFDMGEWDVEPPPYLQNAIQVAKEKATCYHCKRPHYIA